MSEDKKDNNNSKETLENTVESSETVKIEKTLDDIRTETISKPAIDPIRVEPIQTDSDNEK